nr:hypothetical protein [Tanacetum cinerariifolium]
PVPLPKDPYEAIRQAYLVGTDTESKPFEDLDAETPESPYIVAPPTCHVEESEGSGTFGARSTSSDTTAPLSPDHPLTQTTPVLVPILRRTPAMRVPPAMSPGFSTGIIEVVAMSDSTFRKRFRSSYDSSPSLTFLVQKRYRGTSELILGIDSEEIDESLDSDSESKDAEDEGPTAEDEDPAAGDEGLAAGVEDTGVDDESYDLDDESYGLDDESHGEDDESRGLDNEGRGIESDGLSLGEEDTLGSLPNSPSLSVEPSLVSSPIISLTLPSPIASTMATLRATIPVDEDQFIEVGAQLELYRGILQNHTQRLDPMPPTLFAKIDRNVRKID